MTLILGKGSKAPQLVSAIGWRTLSTFTTPAINSVGADMMLMCLGVANASLGVVSDGYGNTYTEVPFTPLYDNNASALRILYCLNPVTGPAHTMTITGTFVFAGIIFSAWKNIAQATPLDQYDFNTTPTGVAVTSLAAGTITPTSNKQLLITAAASRLAMSVQGSTIDSASGFTRLVFVNGSSGLNYGCGVAYRTLGVAAPASPEWLFEVGNNAAAGVLSFRTIW